MARESIGDVLAALDEVIDRARETADRRGLFAVLYRRVTAKVADALTAGFFDDAERMERLDVLFAQRYLQAERAYSRGREPTRSWRVAFDAGRRWRPILLQHLLLGVNAHINLDLGIAAARCVPRAELPGLRADYDRINLLLAAAMSELQVGIAAVSPWVGLLDRIGGRTDDEIIRFSIERARSCAWHFAERLAEIPEYQRGAPIAAQDRFVATLADRILDPGLPLAAGLLVIRARESDDVPAVLAKLAAGAPTLAPAPVEVPAEHPADDAGTPAG